MGNTKKIYKKWWLSLLVVVGLIAGVTTGCGGQSSTNGSAESTSASADDSKKKEEAPKSDSKVTYDNFMKIAMGDSIDNVNALLGPGKEASSSQIGDIKSVTYTWDGDGLLTSITATVQNNVVTSKMQVGLKKDNVDITLDKYNQVTEGMTYAQVSAILGEGELTSQMKIMDIENLTYNWSNKGGTNATLSFTGDKLTAKSQFGLK
ncbi:BLIP family protein [Clostridium cellulovorans]|uniref:Beta-lactamase-inhibitor protein BLIP n=1 Tax=Clostridium cellulovorans (strain ATCC 35296 / DSM 3052 / OCM 3 / 743B) TaxID=573061 RepID=D9SS09_CLOC7|nr:BLIP family protein [Clostridium cellulovorans]ADL52456.1 beta-lactamase-inhibitor protein BLIP [Clostridium cellulovorans 743B]